MTEEKRESNTPKSNAEANEILRQLEAIADGITDRK